MELAGQIRELATRILRAEFRHIRPGDARVMLFDGGQHAARVLRTRPVGQGGHGAADLGVELHLSTTSTTRPRGLARHSHHRDIRGFDRRLLQHAPASRRFVVLGAAIGVASALPVIAQAGLLADVIAGRSSAAPDSSPPTGAHAGSLVVSHRPDELPGLPRVSLPAAAWHGAADAAVTSSRRN
jgi:hypothetical protein